MKQVFFLVCFLMVCAVYAASPIGASKIRLSDATPSTLLGVDASKDSVSATISSPLLYSANTLSCQVASGSSSGCLSPADWTTFNSKQSSLVLGTLSTTTSGVSVVAGTNAVVGAGTQVDISTANGSTQGLLSSADWNTFNAKQSAIVLGNLTTSTSGVSVVSGTGAVVGSGTTVDISTATSSQQGLLSAPDWIAFDSKEPAVAPGTTTQFWRGDKTWQTVSTSESDPVFGASAAAGIASGDISNWNTAYGWGNHASAGYLTTLAHNSTTSIQGGTTNEYYHFTSADYSSRTQAGTTGSMWIGTAPTGTGTNNLVFGVGSGGAITTGSYNNLFGNSIAGLTTGESNFFAGDTVTAIADADNNVTIGSLARAGGDNNFIGGYDAAGQDSLFNNSVAIGYKASRRGIFTNSVAVGYQSAINSWHNYSVFLGPEAGYGYAAHGGTAVIGIGARVTTTAIGNSEPSNIFVLGSQAYPIYNAYLGMGGSAVTSAQSAAFSLGMTPMKGTDQSAAAAIFYHDAAQGTGTGLSGYHVFRVAPPGGSGSTLNSLVEAGRIDTASISFGRGSSAVGSSSIFGAFNSGLTNSTANSMILGGYSGSTDEAWLTLNTNGGKFKGAILDASSAISADANSRLLYDTAGTSIMVDWTGVPNASSLLSFATGGNTIYATGLISNVAGNYWIDYNQAQIGKTDPPLGSYIPLDWSGNYNSGAIISFQQSTNDLGVVGKIGSPTGSSWLNPTLAMLGSGFTDMVDWSSNINTAAALSFMGQNASLNSSIVDGTLMESINTNDRQLIDTDGGTVTFNWDRSNSTPGLMGFEPFGQVYIRNGLWFMDGGSIKDSTGITISIEPNDRELFDSSGVSAAVWDTRVLHETDGTSVAIDWTGTENTSAGISFDSSLNTFVSQDIDVTGEIQSVGTRVNYSLTVYAAGTAYQLTATPAVLNFGTTDPVLVIDKAGTYAIRAKARIDYNAATFAANQTVTLKLRRTNNTAADLSNSSTAFKTQIITTLSHTAGMVELPEVIYTTTNTDDSIEIFGDVSATPSAGSIDAVGASIVMVRLY